MDQYLHVMELSLYGRQILYVTYVSTSFFNFNFFFVFIVFDVVNNNILGFA